MLAPGVKDSINARGLHRPKTSFALLSVIYKSEVFPELADSNFHIYKIAFKFTTPVKFDSPWCCTKEKNYYAMTQPLIFIRTWNDFETCHWDFLNMKVINYFGHVYCHSKSKIVANSRISLKVSHSDTGNQSLSHFNDFLLFCSCKVILKKVSKGRICIYASFILFYHSI